MVPCRGVVVRLAAGVSALKISRVQCPGDAVIQANRKQTEPAHQVLSALTWPGFEILLRRRSPQRCFSAQVGQRVWPEMAGWRQFTHRLFAKASARILAERANS